MKKFFAFVLIIVLLLGAVSVVTRTTKKFLSDPLEESSGIESEQNSPIPDLRENFVVGAWQFKPMSEIVFPSDDFAMTELVNVIGTHWDGTVYECTQIEFDRVGDACYVDLYTYDGAIAHLVDMGDWALEESRVISFGNKPQAVSAEFYNFLSMNAVPVNHEDFFAELSGTWLFPENIDTFSWVMSEVSSVMINSIFKEQK